MKFQFDAGLPYQEQAVRAVLDLFKGQPAPRPGDKPGSSNQLLLDSGRLLANLQAVQEKNGLEVSPDLQQDSLDFDIEMETGTGKTYVYLRSILSLYQTCGFTKFVIVVPGIAIKEGVYKALQITEEHFRELYARVPYEYFIYDSSKLQQIRNFMESDNVSIMVINIDAFRKSFTNQQAESKANIIHRNTEQLEGRKPIELLQETNPIVIIDEPQSVDTTKKSKEAIASLHPLCTFRYSATHVHRHHLIYRLDAADSYEMELVKQIEVAGFAPKDGHNKAYMLLKETDNKKRKITARIELDVNQGGMIRRKTYTVAAGDDLFALSKGRDVYEGFVIDEIYCEKDNEYISFTSRPEILKKGVPAGDVDEDYIKEQQIRRTIQEHLDKELLLYEKGIKVLSLFFIDRVSNYRSYDEAGRPVKGVYAQLFEKHYQSLIALPKYKKLLDAQPDYRDPDRAHNGYFSTDKKGYVKDTGGNTAADDDAYSLIMRDKESLLSFDTRLRFIFSHSALREGWDNPNVFQICTLNESKSEIKKRQEIGRGLRLCVNQKGERQHGFAINTLTVMANESYEEFAGRLQKEYEEEGLSFDVRRNIRPADQKTVVAVNKEILHGDLFRGLWERIKYKTRYQVNIDSNKLIQKCVRRLQQDLIVEAEKLVYTKARVQTLRTGVEARESVHTTLLTPEYTRTLPDIITYLQQQTNLTKRTLAVILTESRTLELFKKNPELYMEETARIITAELQYLMVKSSEYKKQPEAYPLELFETITLMGYRDHNMLPAGKSPYQYTIYDSLVEKQFAADLEENEQVKLYVKLPSWYRIATPVGYYNPDWAVILEDQEGNPQYFVIETKGSASEEDLRPKEKAKTECGRRHFAAIAEDLTYVRTDRFKSFIERYN